ncbi:MAG TPA: sensor histidine kinase, partial [Ktedonobacterales bacterium]|nr:sensor histidine kinase [Ktedonobacterales bacterium]
LAHDPLAEPLLAELIVLTQEAVAEIRLLVYALRPPALDELGLVSALQEQVLQYNDQEHHEIHISLETPEYVPPLPAAVEVAAFRIAQEALTNVVRHSQASRCVVALALHEREGALDLEISDNGRGLPPTRGAGVGLASMRERAEELGGTCEIEQMPSGGTRVQARLPCSLHMLGAAPDMEVSIPQQGEEVR